MALEETRIIELYFSRDEQAIKETQAKYGKLMYAVAFHVLSNHEDSEECVNDAHDHTIDSATSASKVTILYGNAFILE